MRRITLRHNDRETQMLVSLQATWRKSGYVSTPSDVLREALRHAENKRRRSNREPELPRLPGDQGGEIRRGRPPKRSNPTRPADASQQ
ncbi:MAG TPA: hypothetical protein VF624_18790 [Tepidisphaeraceae bacterium]